MTTDTQEHPERIDAEENRGRLMVSEHVGRYLWAADLAPGLNVLDAGCGTGYGIKILEQAGAKRIIGVDISEDAVTDASKSNGGPRVEVRQGDVRALPFSQGEFDLVVCFEVIEHVDEPDLVLDELARVLTPEGILCISTPNRRMYPPGNPYHLHEYTPDEFEQVLSERFSHVELHRQAAWLTSAILPDAEFAACGPSESFSPRTVKLEGDGAREEMFTVALASGAQLSSPRSLLALGDPFEVRWWQEQVDAARELGKGEGAEEARALREQITNGQREAATLRQMANVAEHSRRRSAQRVLEVEDILAQSSARIFALDEALVEREQLIGELQHRIDRADRVMAALKASLSWRITAPLRALKPRR